MFDRGPRLPPRPGRALVGVVQPRLLAPLGLMLSTLVASAADLRPAAAEPPGGLPVAEVPQFIVLSFDDNPAAEPMAWFLDLVAAQRNPAGRGQAATFDGAPVRAAFFTNGKYLPGNPELVAVHRRAVAEGHELANHTHNHFRGGAFTAAQWREEIAACVAAFDAAGLPGRAVRGFRTPFLEYNAATFVALAAEGYLYDTTLEEGVQPDQDGRNFLWPYTLDAGSPGNAARQAEDSPRRVAAHPGLWELPLHVFIVPDDATAGRLGAPAGMRDRAQANIKAAFGWDWDARAAKISGLDWNVLEMAKLDGTDYGAILRHALDLRLAGNRAPLVLGGHTALYPADKPDRRRALAEFIAYALTKPEVRFVTGVQLIEWLRAPQPLAR